ncbi:hypothetical protein S40285_07188 [Stachybotrys chlorohalonatus IBT 40285]|uniref:Protein FYV10 n=1 Tax=Stachybotrys chlorohalonatus (strain IBT 40285) TaxID=1283841 RepID=A0A084QPV8_STAC4|nr:hypothetical protein S40285_07188 [Stachybotrys chlorohalonata IBT 40285]
MANHQHSAIKHSEHLLLDQPLLRLPNELLRKNFRSAHAVIDKDTTALKALLKESATAAVSGRASQPDVLRGLDAMLARMRGVKRKLAVHADEEARLHRQLDARVAHLDELYAVNSLEDVKYENWSRRRLDRLLADHLLRHGFNETASALAANRGMENLVDVPTFVSMSRIRQALLRGSVTEALAWCNENKKELRKMESKLEFELRLQQYIELVRTQSQPKLIDAIAHAKKYIIPCRSTQPKLVQEACGLLAVPPTSPAASTYAHLYRPGRWDDLAELFTTTHNSLLALPSVSLIHIALSSGLSALKTPACHVTHLESTASSFGQGVCPICSLELNELSKNVPYAQHTKSHVEPDLHLLPNGRVYGKQRLEMQARKAGLPDGVIQDQLTGQQYKFGDLKKVYIS